jgi:hypothetical protein
VILDCRPGSAAIPTVLTAVLTVIAAVLAPVMAATDAFADNRCGSDNSRGSCDRCTDDAWPSCTSSR